MVRYLFVISMLFASSALVADEPQSAVGPLMKLFLSGRVPVERQGTVVEMICNRGNEHDLRVIFERIVKPDGFAPDLRLQAMEWMRNAAATRKVKPAGDLTPLGKLVSGESATNEPMLQMAAIRLATTWKEASISGPLQQLALGNNTKPDLHRVVLDGLVAIGDPSSQKTLATLAGKGHAIKTRLRAAGGMANFDLAAAAQAAAAALADASSRENFDQMLDAFLNRKNGAEALAAAIAKQPLSADVAKQSLRYMYSVGRSDPALSEVLSKAAGIAADAPPPTPAEIAQIVTDVISKGDPARGEAVFRRKDLNCLKCHSVNRAGGQVGPELSAVGASSPLDYVVNSILNPNLAIKEQYITRVFVLSNGQVLTGVVIDRDDIRVNMRDANGQTVQIPTADIEEELEGKSLMPQGLTKFLTYSELLDLAKFISELGKPGPYAIQQAKTMQRWRLLKDPPRELIEAAPHLEHFRQYIAGSSPDSWLPVYGKVSGFLPLEELRHASSPTVVILQGELNVKTGDPISIEISSTEKFQVWFDTEPLESKPEFKVSPLPGRHTVTLRVQISSREKPELKLECKTPENSTAIFDVVAGA